MNRNLNRSEHLELCKKRALEYLDRNDFRNAFSSMSSDLNKHEETKNHPAIERGMMLMMTKQLFTIKEMRDFINGFN